MQLGRRLQLLLVALVVIGTTVVAAPPASGITGGELWHTPGPHVLLFVSSGSSSEGFCSGTVVAPTWVLTAAHCADEASWYGSGGLHVDVLAGASSLPGADLVRDAHPVDLTASVVHPGWDSSTLEHDLALLAVIPNQHGLPTPAPLPAGPISVDDELDLFGYGHDGSGSGEGVLRRATGQVDHLGTATTFVSSSGASGLCSGDSGGGAMHDGVLVGVHSFTFGPCPAQQGHSDVHAQLEWIRETAGLTAVDEAAPMITELVVEPGVVTVGGMLTLTAVVDDGPDGSGVHSADYSLDGGVSWDAMTAADDDLGASTEDVTATAAAPGAPDVLEVCVRAQDGAGNLAEPSCAPVPVVDPDGGFVSGGGSFESPTGAVVDEPAATGRATIGFASGYRRGATQPQGSTRFVLRAAGLSLTADAFDWLVVRGDDTALLQGTGMLGDGRTATFKLWVADDAPDTVRLRIWSEEQDVYDSGQVPLVTGQVRVHP